jgi:mono/diheme cytochrome c family protein
MKFKIILLTLTACLFAVTVNGQVRRAKGSGSSMARGKIVYTSICLSCHMAKGEGVPRLNPPLTNTTYVLGDKTALIKIVLNGFNEDVEINGQKFSNTMTPHSDLKDQQIADVLTYVRKSFGNKASSITLADVKKARQTK